eukprot:SAG11_NODE_3841_length_2194_cov_1.476850_1_plen_158_part_00
MFVLAIFLVRLLIRRLIGNPTKLFLNLKPKLKKPKLQKPKRSMRMDDTSSMRMDDTSTPEPASKSAPEPEADAEPQAEMEIELDDDCGTGVDVTHPVASADEVTVTDARSVSNQAQTSEPTPPNLPQSRELRPIGSGVASRIRARRLFQQQVIQGRP